MPESPIPNIQQGLLHLRPVDFSTLSFCRPWANFSCCLTLYICRIVSRPRQGAWPQTITRLDRNLWSAFSLSSTWRFRGGYISWMSQLSGFCCTDAWASYLLGLSRLRSRISPLGAETPSPKRSKDFPHGARTSRTYLEDAGDLVSKVASTLIWVISNHNPKGPKDPIIRYLGLGQ